MCVCRPASLQQIRRADSHIVLMHKTFSLVSLRISPATVLQNGGWFDGAITDYNPVKGEHWYIFPPSPPSVLLKTPKANSTLAVARLMLYIFSKSDNDESWTLPTDTACLMK